MLSLGNLRVNLSYGLLKMFQNKLRPGLDEPGKV